MNQDISIRLGFFLCIFTLLSIWELIKPRRVLKTPKPSRWANNLAMVVLDTICVRLLFPLMPVNMALITQQRGWGLFHFTPVPWGFKVAVAVIVFDFAIYLQHILFHTLPLLWRFHLVHHTDLDLDVTSGVRFHPVEIILSMCLKLTVVVALGPPVVAVLIFEVLLNTTSMFNHSNIFLPPVADRILRFLVVTPDMHRVHHSIIPRETNSNFGFSFSWWDRLLGTYRGRPAKGHQGMTIGISKFLDKRRQTLPWLLTLPFLKKAKP